MTFKNSYSIDGGTADISAYPPLSIDNDLINVGKNHKHNITFSETFPLIISSHDFSNCPKTPENFHDYLEVSIVNKGRGLFKVGHNEYSISDGDVVFMGPSILHTIEVSELVPLFVTSVYFMPGLVFCPGEPESNFDWLSPFYDQNVMRYPILEGKHSQCLIDHFHNLVRTQAEGSRYRNFQARINLLEILLDVLKILHIQDNDPEQPIYTNSNNTDRLDRVLSMINKQYQDKLSLTEVAEEACMSVQHFCRFFKNATGNTFTEHLTRIRVAHAKQLLLQGHLRITDIAYEVGFGSQSYFFRAFRQVTGTSPREFAKSVSPGRLES